MPDPKAKEIQQVSEALHEANSTFTELLKKALSRVLDWPGPHAGRLIFVDSRPVRRRLRSVSSGRSAVTDSDLLFVGLACLRPDFALLDDANLSDIDPIQLSRLKRTLAGAAERRDWSIVNATRLMTAIDEAARVAGGCAEWIVEGVDKPRIVEILAIPDDHLVLGFIAVWLSGDDQDLPQLTFGEEVPIDRNGFGGGWPPVANSAGSGDGPSSLL